MILHNTNECKTWLERKAFYPSDNSILIFEPHITEKYYATQCHVLDSTRKFFQHDVERINKNIDLITKNYPQLNKILEKLHIFLCPNPSVATYNACANTEFIIYFARSTQIPWCMTDYITAHELGHCVQMNLCKENSDNFYNYLELRKVPKGACKIYKDYDEEKEENIYEYKESFLYSHGTTEQKREYHDWDKNPIEWFAEDFRYLFGTDQGDKFWGMSIEPPGEEIKKFMLSLKGDKKC